MPSGSVIGAMMHGNTEWMNSKEVFRNVGILEILLCVVLALVTWIGSMLGF